MSTVPGGDPLLFLPEPDATLFFRQLCTMRVGGPVEQFVVCQDAEQLVEHSRQVWSRGDDWLLLAGGSNTVVSEEGAPGTVLLVRSQGITQLSQSDTSCRIRVQAGHSWDACVAEAVRQGWSGIEALSGIPGSVGAAPVQNIGAYGQELSETLLGIEFFDYDSDEILWLSAEELALGYRTSALKQGRLGVVLSVDLELGRSEDTQNPLSAPIKYGQLADALGVHVGDRVPIREVRRAVLRVRSEKGMLLDEHNHDSWSAGSFFTNPIVTESAWRTVAPQAPCWPLTPDEAYASVLALADWERGAPVQRAQASQSPRMVKLSAAWLIEQVGLRRGFSLPGSAAALSSAHTLAITNRGAATAEQVAELARFVQQRVQSEFGVMLQPEPHLVGLEL